jgi:hypothetical protein
MDEPSAPHQPGFITILSDMLQFSITTIAVMILVVLAMSIFASAFFSYSTLPSPQWIRMQLRADISVAADRAEARMHTLISSIAMTISTAKILFM